MHFFRYLTFYDLQNLFESRCYHGVMIYVSLGTPSRLNTVNTFVWCNREINIQLGEFLRRKTDAILYFIILLRQRCDVYVNVYIPWWRVVNKFNVVQCISVRKIRWERKEVCGERSVDVERMQKRKLWMVLVTWAEDRNFLSSWKLSQSILLVWRLIRRLRHRKKFGYINIRQGASHVQCNLSEANNGWSFCFILYNS